MLTKLSWLSLMFILVGIPVAECPGQAGADPDQQQPPTARSAADLTIPQLLGMAEQRRLAARPSEAVNLLQLVLQRDPSNVDALRMMGDIAWDQANAEEARKHWLLVLQVQPNDFGANLGMGHLQIAWNNARSAVSYLENAAKVVPSEPPETEPLLLVALTEAYRGAGYIQMALTTSDRAVQVVESRLKAMAPTPALRKAHFDAWRSLVALRTEIAGRMKRKEDFDRALVCSKRLIQIASEQLESGGTSADGVQRLLAAYESELRVLHAFGQILFERNPNGMLSDRVIPGMRPLAAQVTAETVDVMLRRTDLQRTIAHFQIAQLAEKAVEFDQGVNPKTLSDLGVLQKLTGQLAAAAETFERVLQLDPSNELARQQLEELRSQHSAPRSEGPASPTP